MNKYPLIGKCLAVGIIFLFIGVALAPSINSSIVKTSDDSNLIEVTSQACGIQGFGNTTVKLTKEQYQNLEQYLVDFRARLNQTTTREEAVLIFKDAVVELNKYGLLPKGMSVEQAQKLVIGPQLSSKQIEHIDGVPKNTRIGRSMVVHNLFCFVNAHASSYNINLNPTGFFGFLLWVIGIFLEFTGTGSLLTVADFLILIGEFFILYSQLKPFIPMSIIMEMYGNYSSIGLLGLVQGSNSSLTLLGFTGFEIISVTAEKYYLGWAVAIYT